jgi:deltex-like protein
MEDFSSTDDTTAAFELEHCSGHFFHKVCIRQQLLLKGRCAICALVYVVTMGNQPASGTMQVAIHPRGRVPLSGHEKDGTIVISYHFPSGVQGPEHYNPGARYSGTSRTAYLPDVPEGREVLGLLETCFQRRLTFTGSLLVVLSVAV